MKAYDADGTEIEVFSKEELESKQKEAVDAHLKENPDKSADFEKLQKELNDAKAKLEEAEKGGMGEGQKERLKKAKDDAEGALKETVGNLTKEIADLKSTFTSNTKNKALSALSKGDADLQAKIDLRYTSLMKTGDYSSDDEGITRAMTEAATLVLGSKPTPGFMDGMAGAGERGAPQKGGTGAPESENSKAMRNAFGIKDADVAKFADQITN